MKDATARTALKAPDGLAVELPSWGFADTGTRFGKFFQDAAASTPSCGTLNYSDVGVVVDRTSNNGHPVILCKIRMSARGMAALGYLPMLGHPAP